MGCSGGKVSLEAALQEVKANPKKGLPSLKRALGQSAPAQEEDSKKNVPQVFEVLPQAIGTLTDGDHTATLAACDVIERCVTLANDPGVAGVSPTINGDNVTQCMTKLSELLRKLQSKAVKMQQSSDMQDEFGSTDAKAIADAMKAVFKLDDHAVACKQELTKSGMAVIVDGLKNESGFQNNARQSLVKLLAALLEADPVESVQGFIQTQGSFVLCEYVQDPKRFGMDRAFQSACMGVLETCIKSGQAMKNKEMVETALAEANLKSSSKK